MAWNGSGSFTRTNGTQTGATTWANARDAANNITATQHDTHDQDLADGIGACITKDGQSKPTADFKPNADGTLSLGSSALRWLTTWSKSVKIQTGTTYAGTISSTNLTAARAFELPDVAGTLLTSGSFGTGVATALAINVGTAGSIVVNGGALGTPSGGTLTSCTGLPVSTGISGLGTGVATALAVNTGSAGAIVTFNGALGTPSSGTLTSCTGLPVSTGISGLGTGVATALAVNVGSAGAVVTFNGAGGTPSSLTLTNATGIVITPGSNGKRQIVTSGPVDSSGLASFGGSTGSTTVTMSGTLVVNAAAGSGLGYTGSITNASWTGLSTNGTMYLYLAVTSAGVVTTGSVTLAPTYQWGGTYSTTNNQHTFNVQEMTMKVGNGASASQVFRVFVGQVTVAGGVVTAITWYQPNGQYDSGYTATLPAAAASVSKNSNLGVSLGVEADIIIECTSADANYSTGDVVSYVTTAGGANYTATPLRTTLNTVAITGGSSASDWVLPSATTGAATTLTNANWKYKIIAYRRW